MTADLQKIIYWYVTHTQGRSVLTPTQAAKLLRDSGMADADAYIRAREAELDRLERLSRASEQPPIDSPFASIYSFSGAAP